MYKYISINKLCQVIKKKKKKKKKKIFPQTFDKILCDIAAGAQKKH